ncbi:MAG: hypothetical protein KJ050_05845 [Candidatus Omnitrophica bacterium]|nr:MAG: hypothetical protein UZ16_OP3001000905 [Candidatus Hinthialibacteria bacterium OLB16]MBV6480755.1 hypothetical protein [bacterium]MCE7910004.1 hypothetical protein [Candidatus Omnitrophica bacterium COP1]MCL4734442.1 hypothetical protein [Candidatus Omnitrophota bacterium]MCK6496308.1 hypothetical protein [bacterium]
MITTHRAVTAVVSGMLFLQAMSGQAIGRKEFFDRLQEAWNNIQTFQSDVVQESRYADGIVQRFSGKLALAEDGRIAYDYNLLGEYKDESLKRPGSEAPSKNTGSPDKKDYSSSTSGSYRAQSDLVVQYLPEQNVLLEGPEDESLLIQVFRSMLGSGNFDVEKFKEDYKVERIEELKLEDGTPIYKMVATPRKGSDVFKWISQAGNQEIAWQQELWVEQSTLRPIKAVLLSDKESTSVQLRNSKINQKVDENTFLIPVKEGTQPPKLKKGSSNQQLSARQKEFQGKPLDEIEVEDGGN